MTQETDVDWASAETTADPSDREAVRQLRLIESIGQAARRRASRWGPFEIRQAIGQGSFGTVYRAWDPTLEREIALKLLDQGTWGPEAIREARLLATVEHPNIVPVYGADVHDGHVGIWMKVIHGQTLKEMLVERGPFGAEEAAVIGRDLCQALAAVHGRGLVHRDIKAQNAMREVGGQTILMDFGAGQRADAAHESTKGSPAYIAPEIAAGGAATAASDIYSLGVLLFHLVSGDFPVTASSWEELQERHARGQRQLLRDLRPELPDWFVEAVDASLSADPAARPATAGALHALLAPPPVRRLRVGVPVMVAAACVLAAAGYGLWRLAPPRTPVASGRSSVAILPFENLTGSPDVDFLRNGLAQRVGQRLSAIRAVRVVVPSNSIKLAGSDLASQLGTEAVLSCALTGTAARIRLRCDLSGRGAQQAIWTDTADRSVADIVSLELELARRVAFALAGPIGDEAGAQLAAGSVPPEALSLYLHGRHEWSLRTEESLNRSIEYYQAAIRIAPDFALAYSGVADAYILLGAYGFLSRPVANARAAEAAQHAVTLDPNRAEPLFSLGYAQKNRFEWSAAEASFRRGLELNPDSSTGHHWYSMYLQQVGRHTEAIAEARQAIALDASSLAARTNLASLLVMARRYRDGIAEWESCIALGSNQVNSYRALSKAYLYAGDPQKALELAETARRHVRPGTADEELKADVAYVYAATGHRQDALALADELVLRYRSAGESIAGSIAAVYTGLGDAEAAFTWLAAAQRDQDPELGHLFVDPKWDPLRQDPRFRQALVNLGFPVK